MKQGISYTVTINIMVVFIVVTFAFLVFTLNYYKAYKVNNAISDSIEKYEGYNELAKTEINNKLTSLGYVRDNDKCPNSPNGYGPNLSNVNGYCIYEQNERKNNKFKYAVITYLNMKIPIINQVVNIPVKTKTESIYYFDE